MTKRPSSNSGPAGDGVSPIGDDFNSNSYLLCGLLGIYPAGFSCVQKFFIIRVLSQAMFDPNGRIYIGEFRGYFGRPRSPYVWSEWSFFLIFLIPLFVCVCLNMSLYRTNEKE